MESFETFWRILCEAFPESEHRSREDHLALLENPLYQLNYIREGERIVGFWTLWDLAPYAFMEHLALSALCRGKGYGTVVFEGLFKTLDRPLILEVERPDTETAARRIAFYERLGLHLNRYDYVQPPLQKGQPPVPMYLMSWPEPLTPEQFEEARRLLYTQAYAGLAEAWVERADT